MSSSRWDKVKDIVAEALEHRPEERADYIESACGDDAELRAEVDSLIAEQDVAGDFLLDAVIPAVARMRPLDPGVVVAGRFEILRLIGEGGMGVVYAARDLQLGGSVALKTVRPAIANDREAADRFKQEILLAKLVTHPNVCRIYDLGLQTEPAEILFFTMELLEGETLAQHLARLGRMKPADALPLISQMAAALTAAHEAGIVHRDFKPANVLLVPGRTPEKLRVVVGDFGLARPAEPSGETGAIMGTPDYMAPEQFGSGAITAAADIFSLGAVIYEMVTGQIPFPAPTAFEAALKRHREPPVPPRQVVPDFDPRWERIILRCLSEKPQDRFPSAGEVLSALAGANAPDSTTARCPACSHDNPARALYCEKCAQRLRRFWILGTARDCHIVVGGETVSSHHCHLAEMESGYLLEDRGSRNGTWLDGRRLDAAAPVPWGANITLGRTTAFPWDRVPANSSDQILRVGRAPDNDVVIDHDLISAHHARVTISGGRTTIEDLGSTNGTAIGKAGNRITSATPLATGDSVYFGTLRVPASQILSGKVEIARTGPAPIELPGTVIFGRDPKCGQVLDHPLVSWHHARFSRTKDGFRIEDLGSSNGTSVNGRRISAPSDIVVSDNIRLGGYSFQFAGGSTFTVGDHPGNVSIEARKITVDVPGRRLIEDVSLTILPGEIVGLMGESGAGKTTFLNALNGYTPPSGGSVLFNGQDLYRNFDRFRGQIGYSPQDDIMHRELTVSQALYYTAKLRLPSDYTDAAIRERIGEVLKTLALQGTENVLIGSPERKGISGGQRKRVNLAMELLTDPDVLFLDEPTSGLSSEDALTVMQLLRKLADRGKVILLTIHQPSADILRLMNSLAIIGKDKAAGTPGKLVYFGPAQEAVQFFNPDGVPNARPSVDPSPDEIFRGMAKQPAGYWLERYARSPYRSKYVEERSGKQPQQTGKAAAPSGKGRAPQWGTLVRRCLAVKLQDRANTGMLLGQSLFVALLIVLVFKDEPAMAAFGLITAALFSGCLNAAREIVGEWAVYKRERMVNLGLPAYVASKFAVLGVLCFVQCGILAGVVGWGCGLGGGFVATTLVLAFSSLVALGYGLIVSAVSRTSEQAMALMLPVLMPMLLLSGALSRGPMQGITQTAARLLPARWAFEAMLQVQHLTQIREVRFPAPDQFDVSTAMVILVVMMVAVVVALVSVLKVRDEHR